MKKGPKEVITPKSYAEKRLRSLHFLNRDGQKESIGVIMPHSYDLGVAAVREKMIITGGSLTSNGIVYTPDSVALFFKVGERIIFECDEPVTYRCLYG